MRALAAALAAVLTLAGCTARGTDPDYPLYVHCTNVSGP